MTYKAIIFDMDGVLFDTEAFYYKRRELYLAGHGIYIHHIPKSYFIGGNMKQVWYKILGEDYDKWDVPALQAGYLQHKKDHPLPYKDLLFPDVKKTLSSLKAKGYKLGLASSSMKADILRALKENDLTAYFEVALSGEEFAETKPHPEIYQTACAQLGVSPEETLVIEDSEKGIAAGKAAGATVWGIRDHRFGLDQSQADRLVESLTEALQLLRAEG